MTDTINQVRGRIRRLTKDVTQAECGWLEQTIFAGQTVFIFNGHTYGCIGPEGVAVSWAPNDGPFFELPADALSLLSHPAPDVPGAEEVEAIRARHEAAERNNRWDDIERYGDDAHADRAALLAFVDSLKFKAEISVSSSDLDEMRAREAVWPGGLDRNDPLTPFGEACNDRAALLRLLDAARAELASIREAAGPFAKGEFHLLQKTKTRDGRPIALVHFEVPFHTDLYTASNWFRRLAAALKEQKP